jgi:hypothetical protein
MITDTLPGPLNLLGFGLTPPGGTTSWNASTKTLSWSFTSLSIGSYTITYQAQLANSAQAGSILSNNAQLTYSGLASPKTSVVNVTVAQATPILYPNPIKKGSTVELQMTLNQPQDYLRVKVFTTSFRKVYDETVKSVPAGVFLYGLDITQFDGGSAANGLYYIEATTPSNHWIIKLLVLK